MAQRSGSTAAKSARKPAQNTQRMSPRAFAEHTLDLIDQFGCQPTPKAYEVFFAYAANHPAEVRAEVDTAAGEAHLLQSFDLDRIHMEHFRSSASDWEQQEKAVEIVESSLGETSSLLDRHLKFGKRFDNKLRKASGFIADEDEKDRLRVFVDSLLNDSNDVQRTQSEITTAISMMRDRIIGIQSELQSARRESLKDPLTGLGNRRFFEATLRSEVRNAVEEGGQLMLCVMCVDHFDDLVERIGRPTGDALLRLLGARVLECTGANDIASRYGQERFAVLSPGMSAEAAYKQADTLRRQIATKNFSVRGAGPEIGTVTMSFGLCQFDGRDSARDFVVRSEDLLADAQFQGGNIVVAQ